MALGKNVQLCLGIWRGSIPGTPVDAETHGERNPWVRLPAIFQMQPEFQSHPDILLRARKASPTLRRSSKASGRLKITSFYHKY